METINNAAKKPAILRVTSPYSEQFVPEFSGPSFPKLISELYDPKMLHSTYTELLTECDKAAAMIKVNFSWVHEKLIQSYMHHDRLQLHKSKMLKNTGSLIPGSCLHCFDKGCR